MIIDFQPIYTSNKKEEDVSDAMIDKVLEIVPVASEFFISIRDRMTEQGKPFMIIPADIKGACTCFEYDTLYIKFSYQVDSDKLPSYLVHELGEADYLSKRFPKTIDPEERQIAPKIVEIFSHPHCRRIAAAWGLSELEGEFRSEAAISAWLNCKYTKEYNRDWECIMRIVWAISTFPELYDRRTELDGYATHRECIEELLSLVQSVDTMQNTTQEVLSCMEAVVDILVSKGMPRFTVQYPF